MHIVGNQHVSQIGGGQPVDAPQIVGPWGKSTRSNTLQNLNCVMGASNSIGGLAITDSKQADENGNYTGPVLHFGPDALTKFLGFVSA